MPSKLSNLFLGFGCLTPVVGIVLLFYFLFKSPILLGCITVIMSFLVAIILLVLGSQLEEKSKLEQVEFLQTFQPDQTDFQKFKSFTSYDLLSKIAIDEQKGKAYFWVPDSDEGENITKAYVGMPYIIKAYNYSDILAIKLAEDNYQTASEQRNSYFTSSFLHKRSVVEIVASKAPHPPVDKISSMDLEIIVNDTVKPKHLIRFYHAPYIRIRKDSPQYQAYFIERQQWFNLLQTIIHETAEKVDAREIERPMETLEPYAREDMLQVAPSKETTQITMEVDTKHYSLRLHEESKDPTANNSKSVPDDYIAEQVVDKPLSYFEQLIEKNRRQMRRNNTED